MADNPNPFSLTGFISDGTQQLFDGSIAEPGVHLRWSFDPLMGLPPDGFIVQRQGFERAEFSWSGKGWQTIATISIPAIAANPTPGRQRPYVSGFNGAFNDLYREKLADLEKFITETHKNPFARITEDKDAKAGFRYIDLLTAVCLDPYIARICGFYFVDGATRPNEQSVAYRVTGRWKARPWEEVRLQDLEKVGNRYVGSDVEMYTARLMSNNGPSGLLISDPFDNIPFVRREPFLKICFRKPVKQVEIRFKSPEGGDVTLFPDWKVILSDSALNTSVTLTPTNNPTACRISGNKLLIIALGNQAFTTLDLERGSNYTVEAVFYSGEAGDIGEKTTDKIVLVNMDTSANGIYYESVQGVRTLINKDTMVVPLSYPVSFPQPLSLTSKSVASPPAITDDGEIPVSNQTVELQLNSLPANQSPHTSVRAKLSQMLFSKPVGPFDVPKVVEIQQLTSTEVTPWPEPSLLARFPLSVDLRATDPQIPPLIPSGNASLNSSDSCVNINLRSRLDLKNYSWLTNLGSHFGLQIWVYPQLTNSVGEVSTLVDNNFLVSFYLGLVRTPSKFRVRVYLNKQYFDSIAEIEMNKWSRVGMSYDGQNLSIYINGVLDSSRAWALGSAASNHFNTLCLGSSLDWTKAPSSNANETHYPFAGFLADLQIWKGSYYPPDARNLKFLDGWAFNGNLKSQKTGLAIKSQGNPTFQDPHPQSPGFRALTLDRATILSIDPPTPAQSARRSVFSPGGKLTLRLFVNPANIAVSAPKNETQNVMTIIRNGRASYALELVRNASGFQLRFWLNGVSYLARTILQPDRWTHITVSADGSDIRFYLNGRLDYAFYGVSYGRVRPNRPEPLTIGAAAEGNITRSYFQGKIADLYVWASAPATPAPLILFNKERSKELVWKSINESGVIEQWRIAGVEQCRRAGINETEIAAQVEDEIRERIDAALNPRDFIHRNVPEGTNRYQIQGVDIFGLLHPQYTSNDLVVSQTSTPPNPSKFRAWFEPFTGRVTGYRVPGEQPGEIETDVLTPLTIEESLARCDLSVGYTMQMKRRNEGPETVLTQQEFEIFDVMPIFRMRPDGRGQSLVGTKFRIKTLPPFLRHTPAVNDPVMLGYEYQIRMIWVWSGLQQLFTPQVRQYQIELSRFTYPQGSSQSGSWTKISDLPPIAVKSEVVVEPNVNYPLQAQRVSPAKIIELTTPRDDQDQIEEDKPKWLKNLISKNAQGVETSSLLCVTLPVTNPPAQAQNIEPANFVSGGLIAFDCAEKSKQWVTYNILWHTFENKALTLYFQEAEQQKSPNATTSGTPPLLLFARYYPGERYETHFTLPTPTDFSNEKDVKYGVRIWSVDEKGVTGIDPNKANTFDEYPPLPLIATDRRRPPEAPQPRIISIDRADYYGQSKVKVEWDSAGDSVRYQLYRAIDSAIYTRDMEQRQKKEGAYLNQTPGQIFQDDPCISDWMAARYPNVRIEQLFNSPNDDQITEIWRAWFERFYPALRPRDLVDIAKRKGNETAFSLVNSTPIKTTNYTDSVIGRVSNQYFYRLRTQTDALQQSVNWGPPSEPKAPPKITPPAAPVFTKIEAGDRQITLDWALNREPDLKEYRLYRAETEAELKDLRWWDASRPDPRLIKVIPDPRLKIGGYNDTDGYWLEIPAEWQATEILGVYRADEFDSRKVSPESQPAALNYFQPARYQSRFYPVSNKITKLGLIACGTHVAVVFRNAELRVVKKDTFGVNPPFTDQGLTGTNTYYYRLSTIETSTNLSQLSEIIFARAYQDIYPDPPVWAQPMINLESGGVILSWTANERNLRCLVQRRDDISILWENLTGWLDRGSYSFVDENRVPGRRYVYRLRALDISGRCNKAYREVVI